MKKLVFPLLLSFLLYSCEQPKNNRSFYSGAITNSSTNSTNSSTDDASDRTDTKTDTGDTTDDSTSTIPDEIKDCNWSTDATTNYSESSSHLGSYNICLKSTNLYIQFKTAITESQVCFFPAYENGGKSFYIGNPRCFVPEQSSKIYKVTLHKDRDNGRYSGLAINAVMMMKDKAYFYGKPFYQWVLAPDAYMYCSKFLELYNNSSYCSAFKSKGEYSYKRF
ncbi:hypothetical protein HBN50_08330 [Halobacteriovorax sp. GB3]|uniref:hypothetical protein n=1 Tax=Halobacteriovorax sp. GB3 TaxID=2719615 RepID=UPI002362B22A|nr:hypothetical protein [Halobacteriovorax sp. GB3]MDD0853100.1 hypothetical protein [Halobacteriovorax sp. GB3]